ncbi:MAG: ATPase [Sulfuricurvum sp. PC08-66]|nr:MAG: ATPase [Sulfuricurvum sp. PC08-66]
MKNPTLLAHFRSFCLQNALRDVEEAITLFAIFGGHGWSVDATQSIDSLIQTKFFDHYRYIHGDITKLTQSNKTHHALLSALAQGDGKEFSAYRRANLSRREGVESAQFLIDAGILREEKSLMKPLDSTLEVPRRFVFVTPWMRFWFAVVSPHYKTIKEGDFSQAQTYWTNIQQNFAEPLYEALIREYIALAWEEKIERIGGYWDTQNTLELLAKTASGSIIAGTFKYAKTKATKSEIAKLQARIAQANIEATTLVLFAKGGFSSELKQLQSPTLRLLSAKHLKALIDTLEPSELLEYTQKKY